MRWKKFMAVSIVSVFIVGTTLVSSQAEEKPYKGVTIRCISQTFPQAEIWHAAARHFGEEMGMNVETVWYGFEECYNKQVLDHSAGFKKWDIVCANVLMLAAMVRGGVWTPNEDYFNKPYVDPELLDLDGYLPSRLKAGIYKGKNWVIPSSYSTILMVYRKDLLNHPEEKRKFKSKYGYELQVPKTYEQFRDVAEFFTREPGEKLAGKTLEQRMYGHSMSGKKGAFIYHDWVSWLGAWGGNSTQFNTPQNRAAFKFWRSLKPYMPSEVPVMTTGESIAAFARGQVAIIFDFIHNVPPVVADPEKSNVVGKWDIAPMPTKDESRPRASHTCGMGYVIWPLSEHKEAAYKLWEKVNSHEGQKWMALNYAYLSSRATVVTDPEVLEKYPWMKKIAEAEEMPIFYNTEPRVPEWPRMRDAIGTALSIAWIGEKTVEEAFAEAQTKIDKVLKEAGYTDQEIAKIIDTEYIWTKGK